MGDGPFSIAALKSCFQKGTRMIKTKTLSQSIRNWEKENKTKIGETKVVNLAGDMPPIARLDMKGISKLAHVENLSLSTNEIKRLPDMGKMINLKTLNVGRNDIEMLGHINVATTLRELYLSYNNIQCLDSFDSLKNLRVLSLAYNKIESWEEIAKLRPLTKLRKLTLIGNPLFEYELRRSRKEYRTKVLSILPQLRVLDGTISKSAMKRNKSQSNLRSGLTMPSESIFSMNPLHQRSREELDDISMRSDRRKSISNLLAQFQRVPEENETVDSESAGSRSPGVKSNYSRSRRSSRMPSKIQNLTVNTQRLDPHNPHNRYTPKLSAEFEVEKNEMELLKRFMSQFKMARPRVAKLNGTQSEQILRPSPTQLYTSATSPALPVTHQQQKSLHAAQSTVPQHVQYPVQASQPTTQQYHSHVQQQQPHYQQHHHHTQQHHHNTQQQQQQQQQHQIQQAQPMKSVKPPTPVQVSHGGDQLNFQNYQIHQNMHQHTHPVPMTEEDKVKINQHIYENQHQQIHLRRFTNNTYSKDHDASSETSSNNAHHQQHHHHHESQQQQHETNNQHHHHHKAQEHENHHKTNGHYNNNHTNSKQNGEQQHGQTKKKNHKKEKTSPEGKHSSNFYTSEKEQHLAQISKIHSQQNQRHEDEMKRQKVKQKKADEKNMDFNNLIKKNEEIAQHQKRYRSPKKESQKFPTMKKVATVQENSKRGVSPHEPISPPKSMSQLLNSHPPADRPIIEIHEPSPSTSPNGGFTSYKTAAKPKASESMPKHDAAPASHETEASKPQLQQQLEQSQKIRDLSSMGDLQKFQFPPINKLKRRGHIIKKHPEAPAPLNGDMIMLSIPNAQD